MATLYNLTHDFMQVQQMILDGNDGLEDTLESIDLAIGDKLENIGKLIKNLESDVEGFRTEEKRLAERRRAIENNIKRLKEYAENSLQATGKRKIDAGTFTFAIQKNPPSVNVSDESLLLPKYFIEQQPKLDRRKLLDDLKEFGELPGAEIKQTESLRIR